MDSVYVGNLPPDIRIKDIDDFFRPFGNLVYIDVNHRSNPVYALVQFETPRNAFMAVKTRHGYNYEGYTLQLRLVENEVRKRRDASPLPPPPPSFNDYGMQSSRGGFGNDYDSFNNNNNRMGQNYSNPSASSSYQSSQWASFDNFNNDISGRSNMSQYSPNNNRMNMGQQNMLDYPSNNRSNMSYSSSSGRPNMSQQHSNSNRSNMSQQYSNSNRSNMSQQYSNSNRSNMSQQNMNYPSNRSINMPQQNMNYSSNRSNNMPQQNVNFPNQNQSNMMNYSNNSNWGNDNDFGSGSYGGGNDYVYNPNNNPYANVGFEDNYTHGLSGAGRKWFNRYIKDGYSPQRAREKALERRTVPYIRGEAKNNPVVNDPTNAALESIGTTIMSLLSNNPVDNFNSGNQMMSSYSNWGGDMPGPSSSNTGGRGEPRNAVSKQQYLKSLSILKQLRGRGSRDAKDRLSKKYHTQIVNDYESFQKTSGRERDRKNTTTSSAEGKSYTQLLVAFKKKKQQLLVAGRKMRIDKSQSGAFRKRMRILITEASFPEIEAKALAVHPIKELRTLMDMKADYEAALKSKQEIFSAGKRTRNPKSKSYRNDVNYLKSYEKYRVENLSSRIKTALRACLTRVHKYEKDRKLPLTKTKFTRFLSGRADKKKGGGKTDSQSSKKDVKKKNTTEKKQENDKDQANVTNKKSDDDKKSDETPAEGKQNITEEKPDTENTEKDE